ncbi:MAG: phenylalanine--tRNA ligase subunit alpha [Candidatus Marinimicrobia bacterium]|jgi:phenylalanyl-tRNA synthetase alpha chain|nr:phenylalanine--tRNA ligase subunit alpha [Candidatus Neomarinimicrobiota bacterium]MBT3796861.1 phenylalanine--tRNA ligase subunit alpha [Candidatus Neomarinimicrobiota bacterium]MBT4149531.1 phenylalanine--tRNA ligase subunit alpha [Candidatus Neomarinimicrobiota bacterium]MBT4784086.1 phenylalanine--tRNA ligase subunit alpha [Candidatus Neomarinimicrobiota bacterium]MBT5097001.1 phenylalanine--tRNA ligase subunit alpha [Candidatus Neomarinimicrobiota bacterium]|tara:strand:- start:2034 stop:3017 length:984 start_codon:yes stop_codon:yes gene_type:complete
MKLKESIESVRNQFRADSDPFPNDEASLDSLRIKYIGRKGLVANLFSGMKDVLPDDRPLAGQLLNELKVEINSEFDKKSKISKDDISNESTDTSLPGINIPIGHVHPLQQTLDDIKSIFLDVGFSIAYGPEIDDDFHNFGALNFPPEHPARDMQDTFFIDPETVLRTHTSNVQIHLMEDQNPPLRYIVPGRVYRNEAISFKSYCLFNQVEGIYVDKKVSFSDLKSILEYFVKKMFGENTKMRFRPSFFPFTEPSAELDIWSDKRKEWLEILGCGMVDPEVFNNVNLDSNIWHGYAFGMGVERICMLKYEIDDIRLFYQGDMRFLEQF